ncbi:hypothetical protein NL676_034136 [Syzygium grande]|nr:hypothetical protein NL676_034136 [Syzygium grande]
MRGMPHLGADLILIILQFLKEHGYKEAAHVLECESGVYFDWSHLEELMLDGKWNEAEKYLSGFTQLEDNAFSMKIYFEMRKQKYLEALDSNDVPKALDILRRDLKVFEANKELFKEMTELLTLDNIRRNNKLAMYGDTQNARSAISLNWQHSHCAYPLPNPMIHTLLADHHCETPNQPVVPPADDALVDAVYIVLPNMRGMPYLGADLILIILQFLKEHGYKEAAHELEYESGVYFDWSHLEELMLEGKWNEAEKYLSGFTQLEDNAFSMKIYFEMRKQK